MNTLLYLVLPLAIDIVLTVGCFFGLDWVFRRRWPVVSIPAAGLVIPALLAGLGLHEGKVPNLHQRDGTAFVAFIVLVMFSVPINLTASTLTWLAVRARRKRKAMPGLS